MNPDFQASLPTVTIESLFPEGVPAHRAQREGCDERKKAILNQFCDDGGRLWYCRFCEKWMVCEVEKRGIQALQTHLANQHCLKWEGSRLVAGGREQPFGELRLISRAESPAFVWGLFHRRADPQRSAPRNKVTEEGNLIGRKTWWKKAAGGYFFGKRKRAC